MEASFQLVQLPSKHYYVDVMLGADSDDQSQTSDQLEKM